jgi:hypothetical protein
MAKEGCVGIWFEPFREQQCCLCGSPHNLTGEHKFKASALRSLFKGSPMVVGQFAGSSIPRNAQGPRSQAFHFAARMCENCNSTTTQGPDREFDRFRKRMDAIDYDTADPSAVFDDDRYSGGSDAYLNVFRYFAKILSCHVAESGGPRPIEVTNFARGVSDRNVILLNIDFDPTYRAWSEISGDHGYAAHGGLKVPMDKDTRLPTGFQTSLSFGPVRYTFWAKFNRLIGSALMFAHGPFYDKCLAAYEEALCASETVESDGYREKQSSR